MPARSALTSASAGLLLVAFLWGATFTTGKIAVSDVPPLTTAMLRFGLAALALLPLYLRERRSLRLLPRGMPAWRAITLLALTAVCGYNALFFGGLRLAPSSDSILLIPTTSPVWTAIFAALILGERLSIRLRIGMVIALLGMGLVLAGGPQASYGGDRLTGNVLFIGAAIVFGLSHVIGRITTRHITPLGATTLAGFIGAMLLLPGAIVEGGFDDIIAAPASFWLAIMVVALGGTALGYVLWYRGVRALGAGRAGFYTNLVPIFGLTLSAIVLGEYPTMLQVAGGAIMLAAVVWGTYRRREAPLATVPVVVRERA
jgi:drug/metabolite transporter (DMT)-like permease